jgi:colanic acid biosynthesis glycosyl transferase WcaI
MGWANGAAGTGLRRLRDASLRAAAVNVAIGEGMAARIAPLAGSARVAVIPNWPDAGIRPVPRTENRLRAEWGLSDRFVIGYSGNLGRAHAPQAVAELVRRTSDIPNLAWLFIGGGAGREEVEAAAREAGVAVQFRPYQPRDVLDLSLSVPDLHLVSLDPAARD